MERKGIIQETVQNPSDVQGVGNSAILDQPVQNEPSPFTAEGANLNHTLKIHALKYGEII